MTNRLIGNVRATGAHTGTSWPVSYVTEHVWQVLMSRSVEDFAADNPQWIIFDASDLIAACGEVFDDLDDVKSHEFTCGACEGAKESAGLYVAIAVTRDRSVDPEAQVFTTKGGALTWLDEDLRESFGNIDGFDEMDRDERIEMAGRMGVDYAVLERTLDPEA